MDATIVQAALHYFGPGRLSAKQTVTRLGGGLALAGSRKPVQAAGNRARASMNDQLRILSMFPSKRALLVTAICALAGSLAEETSPSAAAQGPKATARPAQYDVVVRKNVMIRVKDGVGLAADL
jgi:hypothetical protein